MKTIPKNITKELLEQLYIQEHKSVLDISKVLNKSIAQISRYLHRFGITTRAFSTKGLVGWNKNIPLSEERKENLRLKHLGMKMSKESSDKKREWMLKNNPFKGRHHTEESKQKQRDKMKGRKHTEEHNQKIKDYWSKHPEHNQKGKNAWGWKGGISPINARLRQTKEFREWVKKVKERDNYTCVWCGFYSKSNHADHIAPFAYFPELRTSVDNGRTLCAKCHSKTDTYGNRKHK